MHSIVKDMKDYNLMIGKQFNLSLSTFNVSDLISEIASLF